MLARGRRVIPYFELREIPIGGGRSIATFGTLVGARHLRGAWFAERRGARRGAGGGDSRARC